ncbi:MAG: 3-methyl-2-oxobutanoate hydroxymethyltransferase, partial [Acidimicrobiales bacterium]
VMISMGSGSGCDAQYLFSTDILGTNRGHVPRHAKQYRDLAAEEDRLQAMRIEAFREYDADVTSGAFPDEARLVGIDEQELHGFLEQLD